MTSERQRELVELLKQARRNVVDAKFELKRARFELAKLNYVWAQEIRR